MNMDATQMTKEKISAWLDGELPGESTESMLALLATSAGREAWDSWHQIGDSLRSDELGVPLSPGFATKMAARLAQEPNYLLPLPADGSDLKRGLRQKVWPGLAVAAGLLVVLALPYSPLGEQDRAPAGVAGRNSSAPPDTAYNLVAGGNSGAVLPARKKPVQDGEILRDPQIQQYLMAHHRYSPSVYSAVEYSPSAPPAKTGTDK
jgi:sigma-E factor negative regulatory protein RseA